MERGEAVHIRRVDVQKTISINDHASVFHVVALMDNPPSNSKSNSEGNNARNTSILQRTTEGLEVPRTRRCKILRSTQLKTYSYPQPSSPIRASHSCSSRMSFSAVEKKSLFSLPAVRFFRSAGACRSLLQRIWPLKWICLEWVSS